MFIMQCVEILPIDELMSDGGRRKGKALQSLSWTSKRHSESSCALISHHARSQIERAASFVRVDACSIAVRMAS